MSFSDHYGYGLGQWKTTLQCNVVSHWLSPYPERSLSYFSTLKMKKIHYIPSNMHIHVVLCFDRYLSILPTCFRISLSGNPMVDQCQRSNPEKYVKKKYFLIKTVRTTFIEKRVEEHLANNKIIAESSNKENIRKNVLVYHAILRYTDMYA